MADITWSGAGTPNLLASLAANWVGGVAPTASDNVIFTTGAAKDCWWDLPSITNINHTATDMCIVFGSNGVVAHAITGTFIHNGTIGVNKTASSGATITFNYSNRNIIFPGEHQSYYNSAGDTTNDVTATNTTTFTNSISKLFYVMNSPIDIVWANGYYPTVTTQTYSSPHAPQDGENTYYHEVDFFKLTLTGSGGFRQISAQEYPSSPRLEAKKVFRVRSFETNKQPFDGGKALWIFYANTAGWELPLSGSNIMAGSQTINKLENIRVAKGQSGLNKILIPPGQHYIKKLIVDAGVNMSCNRGVAELNIVSRPDIRGAWEFFTITDGIYRSSKSGMIPTLIQGGTNQTVYTERSVAFVDGDALNLNDPALSYVKATGTLSATAFVGDGSGLTGISGGGGGTSDHTALSNIGTKTHATLDSEVTANNAKISYTDASAVAANTAKVGFTNAAAISAIEGEADLALSGEIQLTANPVQPAVGTVTIGQGTVGGIDANTLGIRTNYGSLNIGMQNGSYCHFRTDANTFYFERPIQFDGGDGVYAYNGDFWVKTDAGHNGTPTERMTILGGASAANTRIGIANTTPQTELDVNGAVRFRAPVEVIATDPAPAVIESGTVYGMTNTGPINFTLPGAGLAGTQFVVINTLGNDITIRLADANDTLNGVANGTALTTTIHNGTTIVCIGDVGAPAAWYVMGGI
tara:strand:+ start:11876 stop:13963 length:2088 start_codon:yes stop_codon:yes gene_type:complete